MRILILGLTGLGLAFSSAALAQQAPSANDIVNALTKKPAPITRSLNRQIVVEEKAAPPSINLNVTFEYNSAAILPESDRVLQSLGTALRDDRLAKAEFLVAGHTDARGGDSYNQMLSERRAAAVRAYLVERFGIMPSRVAAIGHGRTKLIDPMNPESPANRRVEIINVAPNN